MIWCAWILYLSLAGTYGDLSFLVNRQAEHSIVKRPGPDHHDHNHCDHHCMINEMLVNVGMAFDKEHCHAFEHAHCDAAVILNERVCSNEGKMYPNHCTFVQESCALILDKDNYNHDNIIHAISVQNLGPCVTTTVQPAVTPTQLVATATQQVVTATQQVATASKFTAQPGSLTTQQVVTPAPVLTTTTISMAQILGQVFCSHKDQFICGTMFDVVCASDGKYYPNSCELSKEQCDDYTLVQKDIMFCNTQTVG